MMSKIQRQTKRRRQILISSHSDALLSNPGIDAGGVLVVEPGENGSTVRKINEGETNAIKDGFSVAEVVLPAARPSSVGQLALALE